MRAIVAKKLRRFAEMQTIGSSKRDTRKIYQQLKKVHKKRTVVEKYETHLKVLVHKKITNVTAL